MRTRRWTLPLLVMTIAAAVPAIASGRPTARLFRLGVLEVTGHGFAFINLRGVSEPVEACAEVFHGGRLLGTGRARLPRARGPVVFRAQLPRPLPRRGWHMRVRVVLSAGDGPQTTYTRNLVAHRARMFRPATMSVSRRRCG